MKYPIFPKISRPGDRPPVGEDRRGDHGGVGPLHRHLPLRAQDVPPAGSEVPRPHTQLQQPMVGSLNLDF